MTFDVINIFSLEIPEMINPEPNYTIVLTRLIRDGIKWIEEPITIHKTDIKGIIDQWIGGAFISLEACGIRSRILVKESKKDIDKMLGIK